jgi:hypothetical protein
MSIGPYFNDFLTAIRPTADQKTTCKDEHTKLRQRLLAEPNLRDIVVTTLLQGSYRRATLVQPSGDALLDVDVVVVTTLARGVYTPQLALDAFKPFLRSHYKDKWKSQGRSFGIELNGVNLDLVVTTAPSVEVVEKIRKDSDTIDVEDAAKPTAADWEREEPLWIPDREAGEWQQAHPLAQIAWTRAKNKGTDGHYVNVVKALKWWKLHHSSLPKHPKSYPLEHIIGDYCPNGITSVAEGVTRTLEAIDANLTPFANLGRVPSLPNRGLPSQNVLARVPADDFRVFVECARGAAQEARYAFESMDATDAVNRWRKLFGDEFPPPSGGSGGFTPRSGSSTPGRTRFG